MSRLTATVLLLEAFVIALTIVPAVKLEDATPTSAGAAAGVAVVAAIALAVLARKRLPVTLVGGSLLQALIIASGVVLSVMYILGGIFALLWVTGIWLGHRVESSS
ncbi:MAG TPA: DUF4233 domain-containing protein [Streptosporangiaceae bacterium]|jgi:hypothetical protein|nr:DUF4233 domain-containing protein [Streptosporangiaceae bacterium]